MTNSHFNTTNEEGGTLKEYEAKAKNQEEIMLGVFKAGDVLSPWEVKELLAALGHNYEITSVRRGMTNNTERGLLVKTNLKKYGDHGRPSYCWKLAPQEGQLELGL